MGRPLVSLSKNFPPRTDVGGPVNPLTPLLPTLGCTTTSDLVSFEQNETAFYKLNVNDLSLASKARRFASMDTLNFKLKFAKNSKLLFSASFNLKVACTHFAVDPVHVQATVSLTQ